MLIVAFSRALAVPEYLAQLGVISVDKWTLSVLNTTSFATMCLALAIGAVIILGSMIKARRGARIETAAGPVVETYEHV